MRIIWNSLMSLISIMLTIGIVVLSWHVIAPDQYHWLQKWQISELPVMVGVLVVLLVTWKISDWLPPRR